MAGTGRSTVRNEIPVAFNNLSESNARLKTNHLVLLPVLWLTWICGVAFYFGFFQRVFADPTSRLALEVLTGILAGVQAVLSIYCISANVEDDVVTKAKKPRNVEYVKISGVPVIDPSTLYCQICQVHVKPLTKHCKTCNKCVERYDHHCIFMSTCIGKKNYKEFLGSVTIASVVGVYFSGVALYSFVLYFVDRSYYMSNILLATDGVSEVARYFVLIGTLIYCGFIATTAVGLGSLAVFHYRIAYIGITTVGYHEIRQARGPLLWDINTKEMRERQTAAEKHRVNFHELN